MSKDSLPKKEDCEKFEKITEKLGIGLYGLKSYVFVGEKCINVCKTIPIEIKFEEEVFSIDELLKKNEKKTGGFDGFEVTKNPKEQYQITPDIEFQVTVGTFQAWVETGYDPRAMHSTLVLQIMPELVEAGELKIIDEMVHSMHQSINSKKDALRILITWEEIYPLCILYLIKSDTIPFELVKSKYNLLFDKNEFDRYMKYEFGNDIMSNEFKLKGRNKMLSNTLEKFNDNKMLDLYSSLLDYNLSYNEIKHLISLWTNTYKCTSPEDGLFFNWYFKISKWYDYDLTSRNKTIQIYKDGKYEKMPNDIKERKIFFKPIGNEKPKIVEFAYSRFAYKNIIVCMYKNDGLNFVDKNEIIFMTGDLIF